METKYVVSLQMAGTNPGLYTLDALNDKPAEVLFRDTRPYTSVVILRLTDNKRVTMKSCIDGRVVPWENVLKEFGEEFPEWLIEAHRVRMQELEDWARQQASEDSEYVPG